MKNLKQKDDAVQTWSYGILQPVAGDIKQIIDRTVEHPRPNNKEPRVGSGCFSTLDRRIGNLADAHSFSRILLGNIRPFPIQSEVIFHCYHLPSERDKPPPGEDPLAKENLNRGEIAMFKDMKASIPCPSCKKKFEINVKDVKDEKSVRCPHCRENIKLKDKDGGAKNIFREGEKFEKSLKGLFKT